MQKGTVEIAELLRSRGLRSTPQRRAILAAFSGEPNEHLSADEVHARASRSMPDLGRGTVYATLAEFADLGLLAAFGAPEPVRYETNLEDHDHFRCRLCLRLFDYDLGVSPPRSRAGLRIERVELRAEGICRDCTAYDAGLRDGVNAIHSAEHADGLLDRRGVAATQLESPLGPLLVAASGQGVFRVAFEEHGDASGLRSLSASRRGSNAAHRHLDRACEQLRSYLDGDTAPVEFAVEWEAMPEDFRDALNAARQIPYSDVRSYRDLGVDLAPDRLGKSLGENPVPIAVPCHRVMRGVELPECFVGGPERRRWLLSHESEHADT
jgi:methylated-DNA-[protein]-cysteine S-methyltransferase